jgi:hypothetical protein
VPPARTAVLPLAGVAYTVLLVLAAAAFPSPPGGDASPAADPAWLAAHVDAVTAQAYVRALAGVAFVLFAVAVGRACRAVARDASGSVAAVGGVCCGGLLVAAQAPVLAAARLTQDGAAAATVRALAPLHESLLDLSSLPAALLFAGTGLAALRSGLLPRWLGVLSLVGVPLALADAASYDGGPLAALGLAGLVWFLAWSLLVGVRLALVPAPGRSPEVAQPALA